MKGSPATIVSPDVSVWERVVEFERDLSPVAARALLQVRFSSREHERMRELLEKGRSGSLTAQEQEEMDVYEKLGCVLGILHSKARQALKKRTSSA